MEKKLCKCEPFCEDHGRDYVVLGQDGEFCNECAADGFIGELCWPECGCQPDTDLLAAAPAPTEAEVEAAANAIFDFAADPRAPGWEDVSHETRDYYRCMARAALGVG